MNSTFKVVFNKARGALMVVNEVTSSVQGKGTKTVVAAAVAAMIAGVSGSAMATETDTEIKATDTALKATFTKAEKQDDVAALSLELRVTSWSSRTLPTRACTPPAVLI